MVGPIISTLDVVYINYLTNDSEESSKYRFVIQLVYMIQIWAKSFGHDSHMDQVHYSHLLLTVILLNVLILWYNFSNEINLEQLKIM